MKKSILITGCSSGIGLDAALNLHAQGWQVFASCRQAEDCERLRAMGLQAPQLDHTDPGSMAAALDAVLAETGGTLDALFNNGAYAIPGALEDLPTDGMRAIFEANFFGYHDLIRMVIPVMRAQGHGRIINCSSVLGFAAMPLRGAYNSTKFALEGYSDTLRVEMAENNIEVVLIEPGPIATKFRDNCIPHYEKWIDAENSPRARQYAKLRSRLYGPHDGKKDRFELGPEAVTKALVHALESPRPRARYRITWATKLAFFFKRILTTRMFDRIAGMN